MIDSLGCDLDGAIRASKAASHIIEGSLEVRRVSARDDLAILLERTSLVLFLHRC